MDFSVNSKTIAAVQASPVQIVPVLGAFELVFQFNGTLDGMTDDMYRWVTISGARVSAKGKDGRPIGLGLAKPDTTIMLRQVNNAQRVQFELKIVLMPHQIELLEKSRDGGNLKFNLKFFIRGGTSKNEGFDWDENGEMPVEVPESAWVTQLNNSKASRILLFEVRLPLSDGASIRHPAEKHLLRAQQLFTGGNWRECVSECRQFAQELGGDRLTGALGKLREDRWAMTKGEREAIVIAALKYYCHLAAHPENEHGDLSHNRDDAKLALSIAASLAEHYFGGN